MRGKCYRVDHATGSDQNLCYTNVDIQSVCGSDVMSLSLYLSVCLSNARMVSKLKSAVRLRIVELFFTISHDHHSILSPTGVAKFEV